MKECNYCSKEHPFRECNVQTLKQRIDNYVQEVYELKNPMMPNGEVISIEEVISFYIKNFKR